MPLKNGTGSRNRLVVFSHPALPQAGHKGNNEHISQSQLFPQSCFSQPIGCLLIQGIEGIIGTEIRAGFMAIGQPAIMLDVCFLDVSGVLAIPN